MTNQKALSALRAAAARKGLYVAAYSPGDGKTRFRFFDLPVSDHQDYFGPKSGIHTCLGISSAWSFLGLDAPTKARRR